VQRASSDLNCVKSAVKPQLTNQRLSCCCLFSCCYVTRCASRCSGCSSWVSVARWTTRNSTRTDI